MHEFLETWKLWWNASEPVVTHVLWGHPLFIWARWGKLLELVGAYVALYELWSKSAKEFATVYAPSTMAAGFKDVYGRIKQTWDAGPVPFLRKNWALFLLWAVTFLFAWWTHGISSFWDALARFLSSAPLAWRE